MNGIEKPPDSQRVVITGVGGLGPVGETKVTSGGGPSAWENIAAGFDGITDIAHTDIVSFPGWEDVGIKVAAGVKMNLYEHPAVREHRKLAKYWPRAGVLGFIAFQEALQSAKVDISSIDAFRTSHYTGTVFGSNGHSHQVDLSRVSSVDGTKNLFGQTGLGPAMASGFKGRGAVLDVECASGALAIESGIRDLLPQHFGGKWLKPKADIAVVGGADSPLVPIPVSVFIEGFKGAADPTNNPSEASRPFDKKAKGLVVGEAAVAFVIETWQKAQERGLKEEDILAEIVGFESLTDAYSIVLAGIEGQARVTATALEMGKVALTDTVYINAHETGTKAGGIREALAHREMMRRLGLKPENVYMTSTKGADGHTMGAAGAIELYYTIMAVREGVVPPSLKLTEPIDELTSPIEELDLTKGLEALTEDLPPFKLDNLSPLKATKVPIDIGVSTSFGFGGSAVALAVRNFKA